MSETDVMILVLAVGAAIQSMCSLWQLSAIEDLRDSIEDHLERHDD